MDLNLPIYQDLALTIAVGSDFQKGYPTWRLKKGLVLKYRGLDLSEEAVGFGLPVLKKGLHTIFPGDIRLDLQKTDPTWVVSAVFTMNLVEKIARPGTASARNNYLYFAKNYLALLIRKFPPLRAPLTTLSSGLRGLFGWETTYEDAGFSAEVRMIYSFNEQMGSLLVDADMASLTQETVTEVIVMNEQGAHTFDLYRDSSGICLAGKKIGCWDEVAAEEASFASSKYGIAFSLPRLAGARLFRGRELVGSRLAWAGFGYSLPPAARGFGYTVRLEKLP